MLRPNKDYKCFTSVNSLKLMLTTLECLSIYSKYLQNLKHKI